jgi:hypothetical protein
MTFASQSSLSPDIAIYLCRIKLADDSLHLSLAREEPIKRSLYGIILLSISRIYLPTSASNSDSGSHVCISQNSRVTIAQADSRGKESQSTRAFELLINDRKTINRRLLLAQLLVSATNSSTER